MVDTNRRSVASFALVCVYVALQRSAKAQLKQEWHCASVGAKDGQQGKVLSDDFCFQYYTNVSTGAPNYCCDKSGYYCQVKQIDVFTSNHVIKGNSELENSRSRRMEAVLNARQQPRGVFAVSIEQDCIQVRRQMAYWTAGLVATTPPCQHTAL